MRRFVLIILAALMVGSASAQIIRAKSIINIEQQEKWAKKAEERDAAERAKAEAKAAAAEAKAEAERKAIEDAARIAAEKEAAERAKAEAKAEAERKAAEEAARIAAEKEAAERAKAEAKAEVERKAEAERIERTRQAKLAAEKRRKEIAKQRKGFGSIIDLSYLMALNYPHPNVGVTYTAGYRFNNKIFLGAGAGVNINFGAGASQRSFAEGYKGGKFLNPCRVSAPIFAYFRANFINRRCSPFFALSAGGNLSAKQTLHLDLYDASYSNMGWFVNPQLGLNIRTSVKSSLYFAVGFQGFSATSCTKYTSYGASFKPALAYGVDFHLGFTF